MVSFNASAVAFLPPSNMHAELIYRFCVGGYANTASFPEED
jgi:hypothetical protein